RPVVVLRRRGGLGVFFGVRWLARLVGAFLFDRGRDGLDRARLRIRRAFALSGIGWLGIARVVRALRLAGRCLVLSVSVARAGVVVRVAFVTLARCARFAGGRAIAHARVAGGRIVFAIVSIERLGGTGVAVRIVRRIFRRIVRRRIALRRARCALVLRAFRR